MKRAKIAGLGYYAPSRVVTNDDLSKIMDTSDEWIQERTGVQERRYIVPGEDTGANMAAKASRIAIERAGLEPEDIDFIILGTLSPDMDFPGTGVLLQRELGLDKKGIGALDIRNQCSGFVYGLSIADQFIKTGMYKNILLVGTEIHSTGLEFNNRGRHIAVIFGDGAGAAVIQATDEEDKGILTTHLHADGTQAEELCVHSPGSTNSPRLTPEMLEDGSIYPHMNGRLVFKYAVQKFPEVIGEALAATGYQPSDIDLLIPHQANLRISEMVRRTLKLDESKVYNNIQRFGNTTAASIPIAMTEAWEKGLIKDGDLVCLAAFGSGFTWGSALIRW
jgi:3-oxoacyl-[acyl-carrier-protein] synthase-3